MNIKIERISNGWLVTCERGPSEQDPLNQRGHTRTHANAPEEICGIVADWVLRECDAKKHDQAGVDVDIRGALASLGGYLYKA